MTNKDAAALVLRLVGLYWLVTGAENLITVFGSFAGARTPEMDALFTPGFMALGVIGALLLPVAGSVLMLEAGAISRRCAHAPDDPAPSFIGWSTGTLLLGIYFLILGVHEGAYLLQRWLTMHTFDDLNMRMQAAGAFVWIAAGAALLVYPRMFGHPRT